MTTTRYLGGEMLQVVCDPWMSIIRGTVAVIARTECLTPTSDI